MERRSTKTPPQDLLAKAAKVHAEAQELFVKLGFAKTTQHGLREWLKQRQQLQGEFRSRLLGWPRVSEALSQLQRQRFPQEFILDAFANLSVEVYTERNAGVSSIRLPGTVTYPSVSFAKSAKLLSRRVHQLSEELLQFHSLGLPVDLVLTLWNRSNAHEREDFSKLAARLPKHLKDYGDFLASLSVWFTPRRGRRGQPLLDRQTADVVRKIRTISENTIGSTYGLYRPVATLVSAAYGVAGQPRRFSPKTLRRLMQDKRS